MNFFDSVYKIYNKRIIRFLKKQRYNYYKNKIFVNFKNLDFKYGLEKRVATPKIYISLTSYEPRFKTLLPCLKSLLNQDLKPDGIFVWLECKETEFPNELKKLSEYGINYNYNYNDIKPHKKYFYAIQKLPNDIIITVDDDAIYSTDLVSSLYKTHLKYPDCICARRVHKIARKHNRQLFPYEDWKFNYTNSRKPSYDLIATGVGGVLYPPNSLPSVAFNADDIIKNCLYADDIWLKFYENLNNKKVVWSPCKCPEPVEIENSQKVKLNSKNIELNGNDNYIKLLEQKLNICIDMKNEYLI